MPLPVPSFQNLPEPPGPEDSPKRPDEPPADAEEVVVDDPAEPSPETPTDPDSDPNLV